VCACVKYTGQFVECELSSLLNKTKVYYTFVSFTLNERSIVYSSVFTVC
jgi:hypothetical protein